MAISAETPQRNRTPTSEMSNHSPCKQPTVQKDRPPRPTSPAPMLHSRTNSPLIGATATTKQIADSLKGVTSPTASPTRSDAPVPSTPQRTTTTAPVVKKIRPSASRQETPSQPRNLDPANKRKVTTAGLDSESPDQDRYKKARRTGNATTPQETGHLARTPVSPPISSASQSAPGKMETLEHREINQMILQAQENMNAILVQVEKLHFRRSEVEAVMGELSNALDILVCDLDSPPNCDTTATSREAVDEHVSKLKNLMARASATLKTTDAMQMVFGYITRIEVLVDTLCTAPRNSAKEDSSAKLRQ